MQLMINGQPYAAEKGETILEVASRNHIKIPTLCYLKDMHQMGACRVCVVEVEGNKNLMASCVTPAADGMNIKTSSPRVRKARKILYELMLSDHPAECLQCDRNQQCEFQSLGELLRVDTSRFKGIRSKDDVDQTSPSIVRDANKCILCRRCVSMCNEVQGVGVLQAQNRGFSTEISPGEDLRLGTVSCAYCGQCTTVCPVNALHEADAVESVWQALADPDNHVVVQTAPAIRAALGEMFGLPAGTSVTGRMASSLRQLGFDAVFDTNFAADLTILEEGHELLARLAALMADQGKITPEQLSALPLPEHLPKPVFPMITSCSPGWIKYAEHHYSEKLDHLSSCKSPHMMLGAIIKSWYASQQDIRPESIYVVSVMPCTAKKFEITREEMFNQGLPNVDAVLTTRELGRMVKEAGIDFEHLSDSLFDSPLGLSTGAADIFGVTGGVMEAALRTVYEVITGRTLPFEKLHVTPVNGFEKVKSAEITLTDVLPAWQFLEGVEVKIAVTHGLSGAAQLMDQISREESPYHFIEVMGCPGGCITGGGQPRSDDPEIRQKRLKALFDEDESKTMRKSHENPDVMALYDTFLGQPCGHVSHEYLHTSYVKRKV